MRCPTSTLAIAGHTDSDGDKDANLALSTKRAQSVADYFSRAGIPNDRVTAVGFGSTQPLATNDSDEGKAQNRRIEITVK
jgi:OOP family OmpA-OmpF porin